MSPKLRTEPPLESPWAEFLAAVDKLLPRSVELHCLGAFVLFAVYGLPRPTGDIDFISTLPREELPGIQAIAGPQSKLARKYKLCIQYVTVADGVPENYQARLKEIFPQRFSKLRLLGLDLHDIVLSKLTRNSPQDDADVWFLVKAGVLDPAVLRERYQREVRPKLSNQERHDTTLQLWLEYFQR